VFALFAVSPALAKKTVAPPGVSGASQYQEDVPTASGSEPLTNVKPGSGKGTLPTPVAKQLGSDGAAGRAAAAVAEATAPAKHARPAPRRHRTPTDVIALTASGSGAISGVAASLSGSRGGMGVLLPIVLVASALAVALTAWRRRRSG
jgi:hypothetical protein